LFLEQCRLEANPFAADQARPFFASQSSQYAARKIAAVLSGHLQILALSGSARVGKSTLVHRQLRTAKNFTMSWVAAGIDTYGLLRKLLREVGPGTVDGTPSELRNILGAFLQHQAAHGRRTLVIIDGVARQSPEVLQELEALSRLRLRNRGILQMILLTTNVELVESFVVQPDGTPVSQALAQRLNGFTFQETRAFLRGTLENAGCPRSVELFPEESVGEVQAFTQGIVGDIDALANDALELVALRTRNPLARPVLTPAIVREAAAKLHLKYEPATWKLPQEEALSAAEVHLRDTPRLQIEAARLLVASHGLPVAEITLNRPRMVLGRDTSCDISVDSAFVSRYQNLFLETPDGWLLIDLNSTNGCFVNGRRVSEHHLRDGDLIAIGQHELRFVGPSQQTETNGDRTRADQTLDERPFNFRARSGH
jgi:type II secretory pathway predicted ATPase ExeA